MARPRTRTHSHHHFYGLLTIPRGGGGGGGGAQKGAPLATTTSSSITRTEEERELDAYIEELLAGVEDDIITTTDSNDISSSSTINVDKPKNEEEEAAEPVVDTVIAESSSSLWKDETKQTEDDSDELAVSEVHSTTIDVKEDEEITITTRPETVDMLQMEEEEKNDDGNEDKQEDEKTLSDIPVRVISTTRKKKGHGSHQQTLEHTLPKVAVSPKKSKKKRHTKTRIQNNDSSMGDHGHETVVAFSSSSSSIATSKQKEDDASSVVDEEEDKTTSDPVSTTINKSMDDNAPPVVQQTRDDAAQHEHPRPAPARRNRHRPPPPSPLYRFLLHRGRIGQTLVLLAILVTEWMQTYLPQLAHLVEWSLHKVLPRRLLVSTSSSSPPSGGRQKLGRGEYDDGLDIAQAATERATASRTGTSRKKRRALTKRADEQALQQLQQISSASAAKYRHVSVSFLKCHGLGPFQQEQKRQDEDNAEEFEMQPTEQSTLIRGERRNVKDKESLNDNEKEDEDDDDATWVLDALTAETSLPVSTTEGTMTATTQKGDSRRRRSRIKPSVEVELGSSERRPSVRVGVEFGIGTSSSSSTAAALTSRRSPSVSPSRRRRSVVASTLLQQQQASAKRRKSHSLKSADAEGGFVERLRAAAGASDFSRSLLGAYPGDAPSVSRAASRTGLEDWARKYGYGDWSDDDDYDEDYGVNGDSSNGRATIKLKKRRKRQRTMAPTLSSKIKEEDNSSDLDDLSALWSSTLPERSTMSNTIKATIGRETRRRQPSAPLISTVSPTLHKKRKRKMIDQRNKNQQLPSSPSSSFLGNMNSVTVSNRKDASASSFSPMTLPSRLQPSPKRIQEQIRKTIVKAKNERQQEKDANDSS